MAALLVILEKPHPSFPEIFSTLKSTTSKSLNFDGHLKTPPSTFDRDDSWNISPISLLIKEHLSIFNDRTWSTWFGYGRAGVLNAMKKAFIHKQGLIIL